MTMSHCITLDAIMLIVTTICGCIQVKYDLGVRGHAKLCDISFYIGCCTGAMSMVFTMVLVFIGAVQK